ncbi:MAG: glycine zipper 2TM domain-containing protein [Burkholderiales bacterium]|nr:glycine zipper 2TM domain-containing protein [Burkholderiales bacterium]MDQ3195233.1 glycine zipper 2TM domain-containing protein [Pseudomonadota bacterium]
MTGTTNLKALTTAALIGAAALTGCAAGQSGRDYSREQVRGEQNVRFGVVESVRPVQIEGTKTPIGGGAGAVVGGVAGNTVGGGSGRTIATLIGAVLGGLGGAAAEEGVTKREGVEVTVTLDSGNVTAVTQAADAAEVFKPGDRVRLLSGGGVTRVAH